MGILVIVLGLGSVAAQAHVEGGAVGTQIIDNLPQVQSTAPRDPKEEESRHYFTDLPLLDRDGHPVRFYSDVLKDRVVLINFIFTDCRDACPLLTYKMKQVRDALGPRFGESVYFVSISIDPENDSPADLTEFASKQQVDVPGWFFLTGDKADVDHIVKKLGQYNGNIQAHSTVLLAGNVKTRHWAKIPPMSTVLEITMKLEAFSAE
jgi:cytochrome oxidase Cu insertion factor (SCO1/SenC/PrrC family)